MVCDLDVVTGSLADVADRVRGRDLSEVCGNEAVTVEILAAWIHARLARPLGDDGAEIVSVRVWESADAFEDPYPSDVRTRRAPSGSASTLGDPNQRTGGYRYHR